MSQLFSEFHIKGVSLRNRIVVSPMCQYSADDGVPNDWHLVHLGARAVGGAALVIAEATAVSPEGRITPGCTGLWNDRQAEAWIPILQFVKRHGAIPGIQIAHAGRKASANRPWEGDDHMPPNDPRSWDPLGPSPVAFGANLPRVISGLATLRETIRTADILADDTADIEAIMATLDSFHRIFGAIGGRDAAAVAALTQADPAFINTWGQPAHFLVVRKR